MALVLALLCVLFPLSVLAQDLRGHGGPVRTISISPDGRTAITGSFDNAAIEWDLNASTALTIFRKHEGPVNATLALANNLYATGGDDGRVVIWASGKQEPVRILGSHDDPVSALAASPGGDSLASAGQDGEIRIWPMGEAAEPLVLKGHAGQVSTLAYLPDGVLVSGGYDATIRFWRTDREIRSVRFELPVNKLAVLPDGLMAACADGHLRLLSMRGDPIGDIELSMFPLVALSVTPQGDLAAAGSIDGRVIFVDPQTKTVVREHQSRGWPVWALAFTPDGRQFFSGGGDALVRRWDAKTGEPLGASMASLTENVPEPLRMSRGAEVFRACAACHALHDENAPRAGPSLHGIMGRHIASKPDFTYSEALRSLDIVWDRETISKLFEMGPRAYAPGTKMPEQRLNPADRRALVDFLAEATR